MKQSLEIHSNAVIASWIRRCDHSRHRSGRGSPPPRARHAARQEEHPRLWTHSPLVEENKSCSIQISMLSSLKFADNLWVISFVLAPLFMIESIEPRCFEMLGKSSPLWKSLSSYFLPSCSASFRLCFVNFFCFLWTVFNFVNIFCT